MFNLALERILAKYQHECFRNKLQPNQDILRNFQAVETKLQLRKMSINDDHIDKLFKALKDDDYFQILNIDKNLISGKGLIGLFDLITSNFGRLQKVSIKKNYLDQSTAEFLLRLK